MANRKKGGGNEKNGGGERVLINYHNKTKGKPGEKKIGICSKICGDDQYYYQNDDSCHQINDMPKLKKKYCDKSCKTCNGKTSQDCLSCDEQQYEFVELETKNNIKSGKCKKKCQPPLFYSANDNDCFPCHDW